MATATERSRLRRDIGADTSSLSDADADAIYLEAAEVYSDTGTASAYARVIAIRGILASSAKLANYRQNQSTEDAGQIFEHLKALLQLWQEETAEVLKLAGTGAAKFGRTGRKPARIKEYPGI